MADLIPVHLPAKPQLGERSKLWPKVRAKHLKENPTCAACGSKKHAQVHHVKPFHLHPDLELSPENLITLCESPGHACHFYCGHLLSWRSWNPNVRRDAASVLKKIAERP